MSKYTSISACRLCKSSNIEEVIAFGEVPLANSYPKTKDEIEEKFPLTLMRCLDCGHVQLKETVAPEILFSNYLYSSSDSPALVTHFKEYASDIVTRFEPNEQTQITEIASNDNILLREFANLYLLNLYGVEPASNLTARAKENCPQAKLINKFFNLETAQEMRKQYGPSKIICANNVLAHVADIDSFVEGVEHLLDDGGVFVFENAYLMDMIEKMYFDLTYHEHLQYFSLTPLIKFLSSKHIEVFDVQRVPSQGGSIRVYCQKTRPSSTEGQPLGAYELAIGKMIHNRESISENVKKLLWEEQRFGLFADKTYKEWADKISELEYKFKIGLSLDGVRDKKVAVYGCPAKFALLSKFFDLKDVKYVVDDSSLKQGRFSPGLKIPIVSREHFLQNPPDYCIISAWNMADAIMKKNPEYKGKWVIPLPELKII